MTIQGFRCVTREAVQEKYNWNFTEMRHPSRRTRNTKKISTQEYAGITLAAELLQLKLFV
jgi:hypothetical protein